MKRFAIAFIIALLALTFVAVPALAYDPPEQSASADVDCEEPGADNESPHVGQTVLFFGTINYDVSAVNEQNYGDGGCGSSCKYETGAYVIINASGFYYVLDPDSNTVAEDGFEWSSGYIMGDTGTFIIWPWDEDVSTELDDSWYWETSVDIEMAGDYYVEHCGGATAEYGHWVQYYTREWIPGGCGHHGGHGHWGRGNLMVTQSSYPTMNPLVTAAATTRPLLPWAAQLS